MSDRSDSVRVDSALTEPMVIVIAAMRGETRALRKRLRHLKREHWCGAPSWTGQLGHKAPKSLRVLHCGIGRVAAEGFSRRILDEAGPGLSSMSVWIVGLAGGLDPKLDLCAVQEVRHVIQPAVPENEGIQSTIELESERETDALLMTAPRLLATPASKRAAWQQVGSAANAMVDMETFHLAAALKGRCKTIRCARAISDTASTVLPPALHGTSGPRPLQLAGAIVKRPGQIGDLLRLGRTSGQCARLLADWVERMVET